MLAYILSIGFVLNFGFVSCSISGAIKKSHQVNGRSRGTFFKFRNAGSITSNVGEDLLNTPSEEKHLVKRTLLDIRHGVNLSRDKHSLLRQAKKQKRNRRPLSFSKIRQLHHKIDITAEKRESIVKGKNDTAPKNCKFPFIYDEKTRYTCLDNASDGKKWCSLTSNYDRDLRWMDCPPPVNTPFKRSENMNFKKIPKKSKGEKAKTEGFKIKSEPSDEICDTCDKLPKNTTDAAVQSMQEEIADADKSDKTIHAIVSNEVDNFIGTVLAKHGVPDTEQQELLALNAKLSTELAKEVSCKLGDTNIGSSRSDCESTNSTLGIGKRNKHNFKTNETSLNETVHTKSTNNAISPNVVDNFIVGLLAQHGVTESKQKDVLASRLKTSTDIADQISYVLANANAGIKKNESVKTGSDTPAKTVFNIDKENDTTIHGKVDTFLGSVLAEHGVPARDQKDILAWNAQLSTDITNQVGSIVDNADNKDHAARNETKTREEQKMISKLLQSQLKSPEQLQTQIKTITQNTSQLGVADTKNISRNAMTSAKVDSSSNEREIKQLPDTLQPIYRETDSENDTSIPEHKEKEKVPVTGTLQAFSSLDPDDSDAHVIHESDDAKENQKSDDISPDNDMETGSDDMSFLTGNDKLSSDAEEEDRGIAPDVVDTVPESEETISPFKIQYNGDNDENNITAFAHKEFNRKPQIHSKKSRSHKRITGDENWDKYLMDDGWMPKSNSNHEKREDTNKDFSGEREQLNEEEKTMINYVSDSIVESVKNVKQARKGYSTNGSEASGNELVTYKKLDSGKKPYLIYRVKQSRNDYKKPPGVDALDSKTQKIIPGAKNINIIIINNRNNTLDLNDIENTIAHSSETLGNFNNSEPTTETATTSNITLLNKTDENVNQIDNITQETASLLRNSSNIILGNACNNTPSIYNNTPMNFSNSTIAKITLNASNTSKMKHKTNNNINNSDSEFDIERKFNESKEYLQQSDGKTDKNVSFSKLLVEYDKNSESPALQSLRKSGLISMNYAPEEIEIKTFGGNAKGKKCMFPFIYDGDTYFNCININKDKPWCSVRANYDKLPEWGYCNDEQLAIDEVRTDGKPTSNEVQAQRQQQLAEMVHNQGEEVVSKHSGMKTFGGNANGARCVMPFVYDGQTHESCIPRSDGTAWCAASHSYDIHPVWGNCCDNEIYKC